MVPFNTANTPLRTTIKISCSTVHIQFISPQWRRPHTFISGVLFGAKGSRSTKAALIPSQQDIARSKRTVRRTSRRRPMQNFVTFKTSNQMNKHNTTTRIVSSLSGWSHLGQKRKRSTCMLNYIKDTRSPASIHLDWHCVTKVHGLVFHMQHHSGSKLQKVRDGVETIFVQ